MAKIKVKCNCPDSTGKRPANPYSNYTSNFASSDWSDDFAGIGDLVEGAYCKHEMAAILYFEKETEAGLPPRDMTIPDNLKLTKPVRTFQLNKPNQLGDYFGF